MITFFFSFTYFDSFGARRRVVVGRAQMRKGMEMGLMMMMMMMKGTRAPPCPCVSGAGHGPCDDRPVGVRAFGRAI